MLQNTTPNQSINMKDRELASVSFRVVERVNIMTLSMVDLHSII